MSMRLRLAFATCLFLFAVPLGYCLLITVNHSISFMLGDTDSGLLALDGAIDCIVAAAVNALPIWSLMIVCFTDTQDVFEKQVIQDKLAQFFADTSPIEWYCAWLGGTTSGVAIGVLVAVPT